MDNPNVWPTNMITRIYQFVFKPVPEQITDRMRDGLKFALHALSEDERTIIYLILKDNKSPENIAVTLGVSRETTILRFNNAISRFVELGLLTYLETDPIEILQARYTKTENPRAAAKEHHEKASSYTTPTEVFSKPTITENDLITVPTDAETALKRFSILSQNGITTSEQIENLSLDELIMMRYIPDGRMIRKRQAKSLSLFKNISNEEFERAWKKYRGGKYALYDPAYTDPQKQLIKNVRSVLSHTPDNVLAVNGLSTDEDILDLDPEIICLLVYKNGKTVRKATAIQLMTAIGLSRDKAEKEWLKYHPESTAKEAYAQTSPMDSALLSMVGRNICSILRYNNVLTVDDMNSMRPKDVCLLKRKGSEQLIYKKTATAILRAKGVPVSDIEKIWQLTRGTNIPE